MTRAPHRVVLSVAGLSLAMAVGTALLTPAIAEKSEEIKNKGENEIHRKVIVRHGKPDAATLKELIAVGKEAVATAEDDLTEAKQLVDDAEVALGKGDETTARALIHEAMRLLHGGPNVLFGGDQHGFAQMFGPEDFDVDFDFDFGGMDWEGKAPHAFSFGAGGEEMGAQELKITIDGDRMVAEGKDKDGKDFRFEGTPAEVHEQLAARGIKGRAFAGPMGGGGQFSGAPHAFTFDGEGSGAQEISINIDGDRMTAKGKDKDGKDFHFEGTPEEVKAQLEKRGIHAQVMQAPTAGGGMFFGGPHGKMMTKKFDVKIPHFAPDVFAFDHDEMLTPMSEADRAALTKDVAAMAEEAAELLRDGKTDEGLEKLHEAFGQSIRLSIGADGEVAFMKHLAPLGAEKQVIIIKEGDSEAPEAEVEVEVEVEDAEAPEAESGDTTVTLQPSPGTERQV